MQTLTPSLKRLSRPENPRAFRLTDRDREILRTIARFRFMTKDQVVRYLAMLDPTTSEQHVGRRLQWLFDNRYLDRPRHQEHELSAFDFLVYGLALKGADVIADSVPYINPNLEWSTNNARVTNPHIRHTIETTDAMLYFELACRERDLRLLDHHDLIPYFPAATRECSNPFRMRVAVEYEGEPATLGATADRLFSIVLPDQHRFNLWLEIDRGTMSIAARRLTRKSSFARKIRVSFGAWEQGRHTEQWNFKGFRVASVVPSETRIASMLTVQRKITGGRAPGMFVYTTPQRLAEHGAFGPSWISAEGDGISLLDRR